MLDLSTIFSISASEAFALLEPLAIFIAVIASFCLFVLFFSSFIARRDFFGVGGRYDEIKEGLPKGPIVAAIEYILFFPIIVFFWAIVFFVMLMFLVPPNQTLEITLAMAIATVGVIRIIAYFSEDYANEMAKLVPLTILVIFMLDVRLFSFGSSIEKLKEAASNPVLWKTLVYFLIFIILMEFFLRLVYAMFSIIAEARQKHAEKEAEHEAAVHATKKSREEQQTREEQAQAKPL